ncbi:hypothetical protein HAX54_053216, partial [Datura stramonium]|nr:hypothetical protein [Datura stramonium]
AFYEFIPKRIRLDIIPPGALVHSTVHSEFYPRDALNVTGGSMGQSIHNRWHLVPELTVLESLIIGGESWTFLYRLKFVIILSWCSHVKSSDSRAKQACGHDNVIKCCELEISENKAASSDHG